jgi:hypothetical protein
MEGIIEHILNSISTQIDKALKERCESLGIEINKESGLKITKMLYLAKPNYHEYWYNYKDEGEIFLMKTEIVDNSDYLNNVFTSAELKISYEQ